MHGGSQGKKAAGKVDIRGVIIGWIVGIVEKEPHGHEANDEVLEQGVALLNFSRRIPAVNVPSWPTKPTPKFVETRYVALVVKLISPLVGAWTFTIYGEVKIVIFFNDPGDAVVLEPAGVVGVGRVTTSALGI